MNRKSKYWESGSDNMEDRGDFSIIKTLSSGMWDDYIHQSIKDFVNSQKYVKTLRTLDDMSEEEICAIEKQYGAKVIRRK